MVRIETSPEDLAGMSAAGSLMVYSYLLLHFNGYAEDPTNIAAVIDRSLFGEAHLYHKSPIDPEGLLGFIIPVLWHAIDIGVYIEVVYTAIGIVAV